MDKEQFYRLPSGIRTKLTTISIEAIFNNNSPIPQASLQKIIAQERKIGLALRLIGKGKISINDFSYTAEEILSIYTSSSNNFSSTWYPLNLQLRQDTLPEVIYFFIKSSVNNKYSLVAQANIIQIIRQSKCPDVSKITDSNIASQLAHSWVELQFVPNPTVQLEDLVALNSMQPLYESFRGAAPAILVI